MGQGDPGSELETELTIDASGCATSITADLS